MHPHHLYSWRRALITIGTGALLSLALFVTGCGGGGGGASNSAPDPAVTGGSPSSGPGSAQQLTIAGAVLGVQTLDGASFNALTSLSPSIIAFRLVNAGSSYQGSVPGEIGAQRDEPKHVVQVAAFYLSYCEITQAQWTALAVAAGQSGAANLTPWTQVTPSAEVGTVVTAANKPAFAMSYDLVKSVLAAYNLAAGTGKPTLRLPTDAEWEHACRAASTGLYPWGSDETFSNVVQYALVRETRSSYGVIAVGSGHLPNLFGFFDMAGNVWEWTESGVAADATMRGGSWSDNLLAARCANKQYIDRAIPYGLAGLRLVMVKP